LTILDWFLIFGAALVGSTLAGITGFGGAAILLPPLVFIFGVREAIPILTAAQGSKFDWNQLNKRSAGPKFRTPL
jgi:uncharacterized membrane protein YfcA